MLQRFCLLADSLCPAVITISEAVYADPACEVNVFLSVNILCSRSLTADKSSLETSVSVHHILLFVIFYIFKIHFYHNLFKFRVWCGKLPVPTYNVETSNKIVRFVLHKGALGLLFIRPQFLMCGVPNTSTGKLPAVTGDRW